MKKIIELKNITKSFDGEQPVLDNIDLDIYSNEFLTLLGPSGCGKTTTLRIIGGFLTPTSGTVTFDGKVINDVPPYKRQVNTVFQRYALFPHLDVYDNIAFGLLNVEIHYAILIVEDAQTQQFARQPVDILLCVAMLYTYQHQKAFIYV